MAAAALLSSLVRGRHPLIRYFPNPICPHSFRIRRRISCPAAYPQVSPHNSFISHGKIKTSGQWAMEPIRQYESLKENFFHANQHLPAMVSCTTLKESGEDSQGVTLHFSTFNSDGLLLKQFSKTINLHQPYVRSVCQNLILLLENDAYLCNIATQELTDVPDIIRGYGSDMITGFGYVPSIQKFKLMANLSSYGLGFWILTLGTKQWRRLKGYPLATAICCYGAFVNGAIHHLSRVDNKIVTFNLEREEWEWESIAAPPPFHPISYRYLMELSGQLCVVNYNAQIDIHIWLLDQNSSWVKLCNIDFSVWNDEHVFWVNPLAIENDGRILLLVRLLDIFSLQFYDPETKSIREIQHFDTPDDYRGIYLKVFSSLGHW